MQDLLTQYFVTTRSFSGRQPAFSILMQSIVNFIGPVNECQ